MNISQAKIPWFGVGLIVVGAVMLLHRLDVISLGWHAALWALVALFGVYKLISAFSNGGRPGSAFWGTVLFVLGTYQTLERMDLFCVDSYLLFPWTVVLVGVGFLMMFAVKPRHWHVIIPAMSFLVAGGMMILAEMGYFDRWDVVDALRQYWPIALILFGVSLLLSRKTSA
jgi:hypothetical protein